MTSNKALNPMEKSGTMPIEFYAPNYAIDVVLREGPTGLRRLQMCPLT